MLRLLNSRMPGRSSQAGFSFVELVITVGMIVVATTLAMPTFLNYLRSARVRASAQTVSAYLNQGRQLAIKNNASVCVTNTTSSVQFRALTCAGTVLVVPGLTSAGSNVRLPENTTIAVASGSSPIFGQLGNAAAGTIYNVTDVPSGRQLRVIVSTSGRVCLAPSGATSCP